MTDLYTSEAEQIEALESRVDELEEAVEHQGKLLETLFYQVAMLKSSVTPAAFCNAMKRKQNKNAVPQGEE